VNVIISDETVFRIQNLIRKPISRGFDKSIQSILDEYERLINSADCKDQSTEVEDVTGESST